MLHKIFHFSTRHTYADAVHSKGAVLDNCFGFIDGTVRPISRSMSNQRVVYKYGHKRVHALKFQVVSLPNGLIANIYGPVGKPQIFFYSLGNLFSLHCNNNNNNNGIYIALIHRCSKRLACFWNFSFILLASYFCLIFG